MITTAEFFGGSIDVPTGSSTYTVLSYKRSRVIRAAWASGANTITLPASADVPEGAHIFFVLNTGLVTITVTNGTDVATLVAGAFLEVNNFGGTFHYNTKTLQV